MANFVLLTGRLGKDPEVKTLKSGKKVAGFSLAVDDGFGEQKKTFWFQVILWEKQAENAGKYLKKGSKVLVQGKLTAREFESEGVKKFVTEIVGFAVEYLDTKESGKKTTTAAAEEDGDSIPF